MINYDCWNDCYDWFVMNNDIESVDVVSECKMDDWWAIDMEMIWEKEEWEEIIKKWEFDMKMLRRAFHWYEMVW